MRVTAAMLYEVRKPVNVSGTCRLDELISRRLPPGELNHAFDLMVQGEVKRRAIVYP